MTSIFEGTNTDAHRKIEWRWSIIYSLTFHVMFLVGLWAATEVHKPIEKEVMRGSIQTSAPIEKTTPAMLKSGAYYASKSDTGSSPQDRFCEGRDSSFVGVGVETQFGSGRVILVPEQYPAYKAGIRLGDVIIDPYTSTVKNGYVTFEVKNQDGIKRVRVHAEKICYR